MKPEKRMLLLSSSRIHSHDLLDHAESEIRDLFGSVPSILFFPFALAAMDEYARRYRARFERMGYGVFSIHEFSNQRSALENAEAVFVGGGNTFRLLKALYEHDLLTILRNRVLQGIPYAGSSAGTNIVAPTIRTTNDMPIVEPPSLRALNLIPFQINPHYVDADPDSTHMGETREERLIQYLEENEVPVIGLREPCMIRIRGSSVRLEGNATSRIFRRGQEPVEVFPGTDLNLFLTQ